MRWFWIDRFTKFVAGESAEAIKSVSLSEEAVDEYAPGRTFLPAALIIEGLAQSGGLLLGQISDFKDRVVLAKVGSSEFYFEAYPGDTLTYRVKIVSQEGAGAIVEGTSHKGDQLQAKINLMFASLDDERFENVELFEPAQFCRMLRLLRLFEVGVYPDGRPVEVPEHMIEAEKAYLKVGLSTVLQ
jgi:3-hydroxyacyl-[acyl-carrier-protein] dehydratase